MLATINIFHLLTQQTLNLFSFLLNEYTSVDLSWICGTNSYYGSIIHPEFSVNHGHIFQWMLLFNCVQQAHFY